MKILFVGGAYPQESYDLFASLCKANGLNAPSNTFQWAIIDGLTKNGSEYYILSCPFLPCYPRYFKKLHTPKRHFYVYNKSVGETVSYCNFPIIKNSSISRHLYVAIAKWIREQGIIFDDQFIILTYTVESSFINAIKPFRKKYPNIIVAAIVTDLVDEYFNPVYHRSFLKTIQGKIEIKTVHNNYKHIDKFILLSKSMEEKIPEAVGRNIIVEGIHLGECTPPTFKTAKEKMLLYTGALATHACIDDLVDAFMLTSNPDFRLVVCGGGELSKYVKDKAKEDNRIIYKGIIPRDEAVKLQQQATAVINPRKPTVSLTKYSFPSKTMEYLSSGTPMVGYKLLGIPDEYYQYMYTVDGLENEAMTKTIEEVLSKPDEELQAKALEAIGFIKKYKNSEYQVKRIINFLEK